MIEILKAALRESPDDQLTYLALADALEEAGRTFESAMYRQGKPSLDDVISHFKAFYETRKDWGIFQPVIRKGSHFSARRALYVSRRDEHSFFLAKLLLRLSPRQRRKIGRIVGWLEKPGDFKRITIPLVRRIYPQLIASQITSVQPLLAPTGLMYYLRYRHTQNSGSQSVDNGSA